MKSSPVWAIEQSRQSTNPAHRQPVLCPRANSPDRALLTLHRIGNRAVGRLMHSGVIQAKLKIGRPNDRYEQEADWVAGQMMRMSEPDVRLKPT